MTAPPPHRGGFFVGQIMSEEKAAPEAVVNEPSESQIKQDQTANVSEAQAEEELPDTWPEAEPDKTGEAEGDDDEKGEDEKPRKRTRAERLRRQNERLHARIAELESGSVSKTVQDDSSIEAEVTARIGEPPKEADFADWFDYQTAKTAYDLDKRQVTRQIKEGAQQAKTANAERIRELAEDYQDNLGEVAKAVPDLMEVLGKSTYRPTPLIETLVLEAGEKAPLVAYFLAKNPRTAAALNTMSPLEAAREVGRIEGKVALPKPKTATSASPPPSAVRGSASPNRGLGKSMSDYERWRNS
jgi:hypothetical protein